MAISHCLTEIPVSVEPVEARSSIWHMIAPRTSTGSVLTDVLHTPLRKEKR